jgi:ureidoacrylate peracid hydrolase
MSDLTASAGAQPFEPLHNELVLGRTVILHIDAQNDFLHEDGHYAKSGIDISHMRRSIEPIKTLTAECRRRGVPIIWTRHGTKGVLDGGPFMQHRPFLREAGLRQNTWGYEVYESLDPRSSDWFVEKTRLSAFYNTNLEVVLRGLNAHTVIVTGVLTNQCVAATGKDAMFRDFLPIVVEEATGTTLPNLHEPALEMMRVGWAEVASMEHVMTQLQTFPLTNALPDERS